MVFTGKFVYIAHHFTLLWLNPVDFRFDRVGRSFEHTVLKLRGFLSKEGAKIVFFIGKFHLAMAQSF